ncbi:MAG: tRNA-dependent cyclodipeptide synthase [Flammeovirgaceae bacterium]|jgi:tRNA-dependent cyclodipeptide synthase
MTMQLDTSDKYRVRIENITPSDANFELSKKRKCVLGVSMSNPVFWRSSLGTMLSWMDKNFDSSLILVGDYLQRLNEQISNGNDADLAIETAMQKGDLFETKLNQYLPKYKTDKFHVARWKPFYESADFEKHKIVLDKIYNSNLGVKKSIDETAKLFVSQKQDKVDFKVSEGEAIRLSVEYLLEEMAVFSILIDQGWDLVLYPGAQLPLLMEIAKGEFDGIPNSLNKGTYVELKVRKK